MNISTKEVGVYQVYMVKIKTVVKTVVFKTNKNLHNNKNFNKMLL